MALILQLTGKPGTGKTTSYKTLDPTSTVIFDADGKGLSWAGWRKDYNATNKNYFSLSNLETIKSYLLAINNSALHVKVVIIDTINTILTNYLHENRKKPGFDIICRSKISLIDGNLLKTFILS